MANGEQFAHYTHTGKGPFMANSLQFVRNIFFLARA